MSAAFHLSLAARRQLESEARAAFPRECCGLIEGRHGAIEILHPVQNLSTRRDRFEIDPKEQFRLLKETRARGTDIIGCYHSHPNGKPEPSITDSAGAGEDNFLWLIVALTGLQSPVTIEAFVFGRGKFQAAKLG